MIKVIASDMDGTLLGEDHKVAARTLEAIHKAQEKGIRFMIATGRNFRSAMEQLGDLELECDYIVGSGAEIRNSKQEVIDSTPISMEICEEIRETLKPFPISIIYCTDEYDYRIGTLENVEESILKQIELFHMDMPREEIIQTELYQRVKSMTKIVEDFQELKKKEVPVYKIFLFSDDLDVLHEIQEVLEKNEKIAVSSSFKTNLEITDVEAQKGPVLKKYIESLGYTMDEVMAFGDSLNDYSMLSMDFGATIAMGNADELVKNVSKYVTKRNRDCGVAYVIENLLKEQYK